MFRISLIVCLLIHGITAKPFKTWHYKIADADHQDTIMNKEGLEVEPPEDMVGADYVIDPSMKFWKSMMETGHTGKYQKAEEDHDESYHPSVAELVNARLQNPEEADASLYGQTPEVAPDDVIAKEDHDEVDHRARKELIGYLKPLVSKTNVDSEIQADNEPEEDMDDLYHADPRPAAPEDLSPLGGVGTGVRVHWTLEEDMDDLYHADPRPAAPEDLSPLGEGVGTGVRVHWIPEEDMDDLYHADQLNPVRYHGDAEPLPADEPMQRVHSQPEEDLDELYHP